MKIKDNKTGMYNVLKCMFDDPSTKVVFGTDQKFLKHTILIITADSDKYHWILEELNKDIKTMSDEELVLKYRNGDEKAVDFLLEKYKNLVRKEARAYFLEGADGDDLLQEGMIGLFKAVRDFRMDKDASFYHFAEICITRQLYSALEASNRKKHMPLNTYISFSLGEGENGVSLEDMISEHSESPEQMVIEKEVREEFFYRLKKELSKMECEVLNLYLDGNNYLQIAQILKKEPKAIDNALQRIRQKIRNLEN